VPDALSAFVDGTLGSPNAIAASINRSIAFALVGIGFVIANRANLVNVGGEGQIAVGGIAATAVALYGGVADLPAGLPFLVPLLAAMIAGMIWGAIPGVLKIKVGTNEVISTLLLTFIALPVVYWSVESVHLLRKPLTEVSSLPESAEIADPTKLPMLFPSDATSPLHIGLLLFVVAVIVVWVVLKRSAFGLKLRAVGLNELASRRAGYGFDGLVVGLLSRGSPLGVVIGALLFGFLRSGSIAMEISAHVPAAVVLICQGLIVIAVAGSTWLIDRRTGK
jgi:simple sugar transport system permease protein